MRTDRLILRDFRPSDLTAYCELRAHPNFQRFYPAHDVSPERSTELLRDFLGWARQHPRLRYQLAIEEPFLGLLGSCGVRIKADDHRQAEFGCELGREYWGRGYATEAARALIGFAFSELGVLRVRAETLSGNSSAIGLARRLGMQIENHPSGDQGVERHSAEAVTLGIESSEWNM